MIEFRNVSKKYSSCFAVKNLSLTLEKGEILGLIGESGCGKSSLAKMLMKLEPPSSGTIFFQGQDIQDFPSKDLAKKMQMVFQDPYSSLNPLLRVEKLIEEPLRIHNQPSRVDELLNLVGLSHELKYRYPHELSGGQRQRVTMARAIALEPEVLICDESISSLDLTIQAQIVHLLLNLQKKLNLTMLFIAHDLSIVRYLSDRIAVMKDGEIVESLPADAFFAKAAHPETQKLIAATLWPKPHPPVNLKPHNKEAIDLEKVQVPE